MRIVRWTLLVLSVVALSALLAWLNIPKKPTRADPKRLVELTFVENDIPEGTAGHTVVTYWLTDTQAGVSRSVYNWANQGGYSAVDDAQSRATRCVELLNNFPSSAEPVNTSNSVVTVSFLDHGARRVTKFPIDQVPAEIKEVLSIMGFSTEYRFNRLKFLDH